MEIVPMNIYYKFKRLINYLKKNGVLPTIQRIRTLMIQKIFKNKAIILYVDLQRLEGIEFELPPDFKVIKVDNEETIKHSYLPQLIQMRNQYREMDDISNQIRTRFYNGGTIWIIDYQNRFAGFAWSIRGDFFNDYYFPLTAKDVLLIDTEILPEFRGQGINPILIKYIFHMLHEDKFIRAFGNVKIWMEES